MSRRLRNSGKLPVYRRINMIGIMSMNGMYEMETDGPLCWRASCPPRHWLRLMGRKDSGESSKYGTLDGVCGYDSYC